MLLGSVAIIVAASVESYAAIRRPKLALAILLLLVAIQAQYLGSGSRPPQLSVTFGSLTISVFDAFTVIFGLVGVTRLVLGRRLFASVATSAATLTLLAMTIVGTFAWVFQFSILKHLPAGVTDTGLQSWRQPLFAVALLLWALTVPDGWSLNRLRPIIWVSAFIVIPIQIAAVARYGIAGPSAEWIGNQRLETARVLQPQAALMLLVAAWLLVVDSALNRWLRVLGVPVLLLTLFLSQSRAVWLAALASALALGWTYLRHTVRDYRQATRLACWVFGFAFAAVCLAIALVPAARTSLTHLSYVSWRLDLWSRLLSADHSPGSWIFGSIFGPNASTLQLLNANDSHSAFIEPLVWLGAIGLLAALTLVIAPLVTRPRPELWILAPVVAAGLFSFGLFYPWPVWTYALLGAVSWRRSGREQAAGSVGHVNQMEGVGPAYDRSG